MYLSINSLNGSIYGSFRSKNYFPQPHRGKPSRDSDHFTITLCCLIHEKKVNSKKQTEKKIREVECGSDIRVRI